MTTVGMLEMCSVFLRKPGYTWGTHLNNATYEYVITLVVDPVLQHHLVYHGNEDLVLKIKGKGSRVNKRMCECFMWFSLATVFPTLEAKKLSIRHLSLTTKSLTSKAFPARLLPDEAARGLVVLRLGLKTIGGFWNEGGDGIGGEEGVNVTSSTLINTTPCRQTVNDISSLAGSNKDYGGWRGYRNAVHVKPAAGRLKVAF